MIDQKRRLREPPPCRARPDHGVPEQGLSGPPLPLEFTQAAILKLGQPPFEDIEVLGDCPLDRIPEERIVGTEGHDSAFDAPNLYVTVRL